MRVKLILPALTEAKGPFWRPIKYSLFPPLGLATLAAHLDPDDEVTIADEHVERLSVDDAPDLVGIEVYITNARRAYAIADHYRARGSHVILGGLHVTALPREALAHADTICVGPADRAFPEFLRDFAAGRPRRCYAAALRTLDEVPLPRRDLVRRSLYLVPNSLVVSRGCPHRCDFCYNDGFYGDGRSFFTRTVDRALEEIESLPGRHLYFLDDHLFGNPRFASALFDGMQGMRRLFQGAATVGSVLRGPLVEQAVRAGLRSLFVGFETLSPANLAQAHKPNLGLDYGEAIRRLDDLGVMINGSFVFGLDDDDKDVFQRTVDWAVSNGITTATFHVLTPYPGTVLFERLQKEGRILTRDWDLYDTRHAVYQPRRLTAVELEEGYHWARDAFSRWGAIARGAAVHPALVQRAKHFVYGAAWKRLEPVWDVVIRTRRLAMARPLLERVLAPGAGPRRARPRTAALRVDRARSAS